MISGYKKTITIFIQRSNAIFYLVLSTYTSPMAHPYKIHRSRWINNVSLNKLSFSQVRESSV